MTFLALDQGTTSTRLLRCADGKVTLVGQIRHATRHPAPGHVEQDAAEILANCRYLIDAAGPATALGLANQGESCLAWDARTGEPLSPVLVWQDSRTRDRLAAMQADGLAAQVTARSGLPLDPYFSAAKLGWLTALPQVADARRRGTLRLGTTDAFLLDRLTGRFVTDRTTASRTGLMNLATGQWDGWLCDAFGVPQDCLPAIRPTIGDFGTVRGTPVTASVVDQQAALYGHGCHTPGQAKITFGTGAFALAVLGTDLPDPARLGGLVPTVAWDLGDGPVYAVEGGVPDAASAVDWAIRAGLARDTADFDTLPDGPAIARGLVFLPVFSGLGAPDWDRSATTVLLGLTPDMTGADMRLALLEGIAFLSARLIGAMRQVTGPLDAASVDGGLSRNTRFVQMVAALAQQDLSVADTAEGTALGCLMLCAMGAGQDAGLPPRHPVRFRAGAVPDDWNRTFERALSVGRGWRQTPA